MFYYQNCNELLGIWKHSRISSLAQRWESLVNSCSGCGEYKESQKSNGILCHKMDRKKRKSFHSFTEMRSSNSHTAFRTNETAAPGAHPWALLWYWQCFRYRMWRIFHYPFPITPFSFFLTPFLRAEIKRVLSKFKVE